MWPLHVLAWSQLQFFLSCRTFFPSSKHFWFCLCFVWLIFDFNCEYHIAANKHPHVMKQHWECTVLLYAERQPLIYIGHWIIKSSTTTSTIPREKKKPLYTAAKRTTPNQKRRTTFSVGQANENEIQVKHGVDEKGCGWGSSFFIA